MVKQIALLLLLLLFFTAGGMAQSDHSAPIKWERYLLSKEKLSAMFPKLPVVYTFDDGCREIAREKYAAYAANSAYELDIFTRHRAEQRCWDPKAPEELTDRLAEIRSIEPGIVETKSVDNGHDVYAFTGKTWKRRVIADPEHMRWIEFAVTERDPGTSEYSKFANSLDLDASDGLKIGRGSSFIIGDTDDKTIQPPGTRPEGPEPMRIIIKPKPFYPDEARMSKEAGTVVLRVEFLGNGSVGTVKAIQRAPELLIESAITAVRTMVFLPARENGSNITVTKQVEYSFAIY